jgi:hypothetical protein
MVHRNIGILHHTVSQPRRLLLEKKLIDVFTFDDQIRHNHCIPANLIFELVSLGKNSELCSQGMNYVLHYWVFSTF